MSNRTRDIILALAGLVWFWWFLRKAGAQPTWLRWATWW